MVEAAIDGRLDTIEACWDERVALGVVCAAKGYPEKPQKGDEITALPAESDSLHVFHAGTKADGDKIVTSGGRVLCVVGLGSTVREAAAKAYEGVKEVHFEGMQYRTDIGYHAMK